MPKDKPLPPVVGDRVQGEGTAAFGIIRKIEGNRCNIQLDDGRWIRRPLNQAAVAPTLEEIAIMCDGFRRESPREPVSSGYVPYILPTINSGWRRASSERGAA